MKKTDTHEVAKRVRSLILKATTEAGSGHPSTSLSATDLMTVLFARNFFKYDTRNPHNSNNDRLIFSKGHAAPLLYALWTIAGVISEKELMTLRKFKSRIEGHPTPRFPYTEAATGSLGQGLSVGVGYALSAKYLDKLPFTTYVLLGDGELTEGSVWEALSIASHYKLGNLVAIADINRLGQSGPTLHEWDMAAYRQKFEAFGWQTIAIDGHKHSEIERAYARATKKKQAKPTIILAKTIKGKGVSELENKEGWHGKPLSEKQLLTALEECDPVSAAATISLSKPKKIVHRAPQTKRVDSISYKKDVKISTRKAYGDALLAAGKGDPSVVVLDAETKNSTYAETFQKGFPERFFEMFIAEQNMAGVALGLSLRKKIPFASTFAAFWSRAYDQIRMAQYSDATVHFVGSHAGISIGQDGSSQMGLEDLSLFSSILKGTVLYPSDGNATASLVEAMMTHRGITYLRTTRMDTPILYSKKDKFRVGGSKTLRKSKKDQVTIVAAGITVHEALKAHDVLKRKGIFTRVIDAYSIKPIDSAVLIKAARETSAIVTVEDHYPHGGLGSAVLSALAKTREKTPIFQLAVKKIPMSGAPKELLAWAGIDSRALVEKVRKIVTL